MGGGASLAAAIYTKTLQNYRRTISNFCSVRPTVFDREVLAFDVARFLQPFAERRHEKSGRFWKSRVEEPNHGPPTCRLSLAGTRPSRAIMNTSVTAPSVCWPASIC